jgi:hypothetical protein
MGKSVHKFTCVLNFDTQRFCSKCLSLPYVFSELHSKCEWKCSGFSCAVDIKAIGCKCKMMARQVSFDKINLNKSIQSFSKIFHAYKQTGGSTKQI